MSYYGKLSGKHYESIEAMRHYESLEAQRRMVPSPEEDAFSNLPAEEQRAVVERMLVADGQKVAIAEQGVDVSTFLELHKEYVDCEQNSAAMKLIIRGLLKARGKQTATLGDVEDAFAEGKALGALKLDEKVLQKQHQSGIEQRANAIREQRARWDNFSEEEAEGLSLEELRRRSAEQFAASGF